jgi:hypothetical protein
MYTTMLYEAERPRTRQEQRELNTINGEIAVAIKRPFRWLRSSSRADRSVTRGRPRTSEQPTLRVGAFPAEASSIPSTHCN